MEKVWRKVKTKYRGWSDAKFLSKHDCENWEQYERKYDPDYNIRAGTIESIYPGYPHVYCFENHSHEVYYWDLGIDGIYRLSSWCRENCTGKYRFDFHRVIKNSWNTWEINEIGGGDYLFAAFKDPKDFTLFMLRWS